MLPQRTNSIPRQSQHDLESGHLLNSEPAVHLDSARFTDHTLEPPKVLVEPTATLTPAAGTLPLKKVPFHRTTKGVIMLTVVILAFIIATTVIVVKAIDSP